MFVPVTGDYNNDGTFYRELTDGDLGNLIFIAPGRTIRWETYRACAANEAEGYYAEDVRPFGFIVTKATSNRFSFHVEEIAHAGDTPNMAFERSGDLLGTPRGFYALPSSSGSNGTATNFLKSPRRSNAEPTTESSSGMIAGS